MNRNSLTARLVVITTFTAFAVGFIAVQILLRVSHIEAQRLAQESATEFNNTITPTASIAAYLQDEELGKEVINGLVSNGVINAASLHSDGFSISSQDFEKGDSTISFPVFFSL